MMETLGLGAAGRALWAHRFRSSLTGLSVLLGCAAIVLMSSLAESGFSTLRRGIEEMGGARLLLVAPKQPERSLVQARAYKRGLTDADMARVFDGLPHVVERSLYASLGTKEAVAETGKTHRTDLLAADSSFIHLYGLSIAQGRAIGAEDLAAHARSCVIGPVTARALWSGPVLGNVFTIAGIHCRVVGILSSVERPGVQLGFDWQDLVIMPRTAALDRIPGVREGSLIIVKTDEPESNERVKRIANVLLSSRHHGIDDFTFFDFQRILSRFYAVFTIMEVLVGCLAGVALIIGGIGIMNMMLVSVSERTREIGIRKALGAGPLDIQRQFLAEAGLTSLLAGGLGVIVGLGVAAAAHVLIKHFLPAWVARISAPATLIALLCAVSVGLVFGWLPARRAAYIPPAEAMRE
jgi:putative ABC transport system permease protein